MTAREILIEAFMTPELLEHFFHGVWADNNMDDRRTVVSDVADSFLRSEVWVGMQSRLAAMCRKREAAVRDTVLAMAEALDAFNSQPEAPDAIWKNRKKA